MLLPFRAHQTIISASDTWLPTKNVRDFKDSFKTFRLFTNSPSIVDSSNLENEIQWSTSDDSSILFPTRPLDLAERATCLAITNSSLIWLL